MQTLGPFTFLEIGSPPVQIPVNVGYGGFVEILNYSGFILQITLPTSGTCWHDAYGRAIYSLQNVRGQQTIGVSIAANPSLNKSFGQPNLLFQESSGFGDVIGRYYINVYQGDEIQWYPPYTMTNPIPQMLSGYITATASSAALTVQLPILAPAGGQGRCYVTGFDINTGAPSAGNATNLVLSNIITQISGSSTLVWRYLSQTTGSPISDRVRFPAPIPNDPGNQPTFTLGNLNAVVTFNAYYYLQ